MLTKEGFRQYTHLVFAKNTGAANSYIQAINILDNIFSKEDVFHLEGRSLCTISDETLLVSITEFVKQEEKKFKAGISSIFSRNGNPNQNSYPSGGFCSAAIKHLYRYRDYEINQVAADSIFSQNSKGAALSKKLIKHFDLVGIDKKEGKDKEVQTKVRIGQEYFRKMLLQIYESKCCVTGLNVPITLRASHIVPWKEDKTNRLNPENGLLLSATYDAAFDKNLISLDEDYRLIISKYIKDFYTASVTREYFEAFEGKRIALPIKYLPNQIFLGKHRECLVNL